MKQELEVGHKKPVIVIGDLNVVSEEIDIHKGERNIRAAGNTDEEINSFREFLNSSGMVDTFRHFYSDREHKYTYWDYKNKPRK